MLALMARGGGRSLEGNMDRGMAFGESRALDDVDQSTSYSCQRASFPSDRSRNSPTIDRSSWSSSEKITSNAPILRNSTAQAHRLLTKLSLGFLGSTST